MCTIRYANKCLIGGRTAVFFLILFAIVQVVFLCVGRVLLRKSPTMFCLEGTYCKSLDSHENVHRHMRVQQVVLHELQSIYDQLKRNRKNVHTYSLYRHFVSLRKYVAGHEGVSLSHIPWSDPNEGKKCFDTFLGPKHDGNRYLNNWETENCELSEISVYKYITFCFVVKDGDNSVDIFNALVFFADQHKNATILIGFQGQALQVHEKRKQIRLQQFESHMKEGEIWNTLIKEVTTPYLFIGRDLAAFDQYSYFLRPVSLLMNYDEIGVITFATKTPDGMWSLNCYQTEVFQSELRIKKGYHRSFNESLVCDYSEGPFLLKVAAAKEIQFDSTLTSDNHLFLDYFLNLRNSGVVHLNTPDFMALVNSNNTSLENLRRTWLPLAQKWKLAKIDVLGSPINFDCKDINVFCQYNMSLLEDFPVSLCCWNELKGMVNKVIGFVKKKGLACEGDTVALRTVKRLAKSLPVDLEADIFCEKESLAEVKSHQNILNNAIYQLTIGSTEDYFVYTHQMYPSIKVFILSKDSKRKSTEEGNPILLKKTAERILRRIREDL